MDLQVTMTCPKCHSARVVLIGGGWDIKSVAHDCKGNLPHADRASGDCWKITFDPPRRVF